MLESVLGFVHYYPLEAGTARPGWLHAMLYRAFLVPDDFGFTKTTKKTNFVYAGDRPNVPYGKLKSQSIASNAVQYWLVQTATKM